MTLSIAQQILKEHKNSTAISIPDKHIYAVHAPNQHITRYYFHDNSVLEVKITVCVMAAWELENGAYVLKECAPCRVNANGTLSAFKQLRRFRVRKGEAKFLINNGWYYDACKSAGLLK